MPNPVIFAVGPEFLEYYSSITSTESVLRKQRALFGFYGGLFRRAQPTCQKWHQNKKGFTSLAIGLTGGFAVSHSIGPRWDGRLSLKAQLLPSYVLIVRAGLRPARTPPVPLFIEMLQLI